jgi:excisionase family DNA binding protein
MSIVPFIQNRTQHWRHQVTEKFLITPQEAAAMLGIGRTKTYDLIAAGQLPSVRIGRCVRVPLAGLRAWIEAATSASHSGKGEPQ